MKKLGLWIILIMMSFTSFSQNDTDTLSIRLEKPVAKLVVKDLIKQGKTEDEIYNFLSDKYGDWILYKPKFNYENILLWSFPYLVLVFGGFIIVFLTKKRQKKT